MPPPAPPSERSGGTLRYPATAQLWGRVHGQCPSRRFLGVVCGLDPDEIAAVQGFDVLTRPEVGDLLESLEDFGERMRPTTTVEPRETSGVLTGAIQWSQTLSMWSTGLGVGTRYVCGTHRRSYDNLENRLVAEMLDRLVHAGRALDRAVVPVLAPAVVERALHAADRAGAHRRHPRSAEIRHPRLSARDVKAVAAVIRRHREPCVRRALELRRVLADPMAVDLVGRLGNDTVNNHLGAILTAREEMSSHGLDRPDIVVRDDGVVAGPLMLRRQQDATIEMFFGPHRVRVAPFGSTEGPGFDGQSWVVSNAASTRAVLTSVIPDLVGPPLRDGRQPG